MDNERKHFIENLVAQTLKSINFQEPPVDVETIAKKMGLEIVPFEFDDKISGVLKLKEKVIGVNKNHAFVRRRFSIAHELGHYLLGHDEKDFVDDKFDRPTPIEREANAFAAYLLMPREKIKESVDKKGLDIERLTREFKTSEQAITIRLLDLGLIK